MRQENDSRIIGLSQWLLFSMVPTACAAIGFGIGIVFWTLTPLIVLVLWVLRGIYLSIA